MPEQWAYPSESMAISPYFHALEALGWVCIHTDTHSLWQQRSGPNPAMVLPGTLKEVARPHVPQLPASGSSHRLEVSLSLGVTMKVACLGPEWADVCYPLVQILYQPWISGSSSSSKCSACTTLKQRTRNLGKHSRNTTRNLLKWKIKVGGRCVFAWLFLFFSFNCLPHPVGTSSNYNIRHKVRVG